MSQEYYFNIIGNAIQGLNSNFSRKIDYLSSYVTRISEILTTTNWLLLLLVIVLSINTFINWKRYKSDKQKNK